MVNFKWSIYEQDAFLSLDASDVPSEGRCSSSTPLGLVVIMAEYAPTLGNYLCKPPSTVHFLLGALWNNDGNVFLQREQEPYSVLGQVYHAVHQKHTTLIRGDLEHPWHCYVAWAVHTPYLPSGADVGVCSPEVQQSPGLPHVERRRRSVSLQSPSLQHRYLIDS
ncbi:hypothetical protein LshimejAT787_1005470 [Lyophyllum shimeji]|uniref:Uncharacterized protein n=1 Tax=Lyophyllum shimeji TaxID=47721 RepID=A0A9P3PSG5_LYOSH|nr:hypothetical protein LshimejAT787_1005470 [Lyophyllum shimeji]